MIARYRHSFALIALAALVGFASDASAAKTLEIPTKAAFTSPGDAPVGILATVYATGFEAGQGFAVGSVEPQNGYTATGTNQAWQTISTANPFSGSQHVRFVDNLSAGNGAGHVLLTPSTVQPANAPSQIKCMVNISNDGGADYDIIGQAPSQGFLSWRVKFEWLGTILILDDIGNGLEFVDTGVAWDLGVYRELKVQFDPANSEIRYYYDGNLIYTGFVIYAGTSIEQLVWFHDNWQLGGETADFDAVDWIDSASDPVPAQPATWGGLKNLYR